MGGTESVDPTSGMEQNGKKFLSRTEPWVHSVPLKLNTYCCSVPEVLVLVVTHSVLVHQAKVGDLLDAKHQNLAGQLMGNGGGYLQVFVHHLESKHRTFDGIVLMQLT